MLGNILPILLSLKGITEGQNNLLPRNKEKQRCRCVCARVHALVYLLYNWDLERDFFLVTVC